MLAFVFVLLAVCLVFGGAFVLLRTANKPKVPKGFKLKEYDDNDTSSW